MRNMGAEFVVLSHHSLFIFSERAFSDMHGMTFTKLYIGLYRLYRFAFSFSFSVPPKGSDGQKWRDFGHFSRYHFQLIIIVIIIYFLNKAIEKKKCNNMYSTAGLQGKGTDSCPEIRDLYTKTTQHTKIKIQNNICNHTNSKYVRNKKTQQS